MPPNEGRSKRGIFLFLVKRTSSIYSGFSPKPQFIDESCSIRPFPSCLLEVDGNLQEQRRKTSFGYDTTLMLLASSFTKISFIRCYKRGVIPNFWHPSGYISCNWISSGVYVLELNIHCTQEHPKLFISQHFWTLLRY